VSVSLVNEAVTRARAHGVDMQPIMAAAGITPQMLAQPRSRVSSAQYGALWAGIAQAMDDEFFGQDAHPMRWGSFVTMTQAALTARTGRQALARATGFLRLVLDDLHVRVEEDDQRVRLVFVHRKGTRVPPMFTYATWLIMVYG
ncbi:AraC family transcriptional regulator, partial [Pseudomonas sp. Fl4BN2]|nr:AraC family transcriptional regulator [Pseudomonas sp. Fl4BN2]